MKLPYFKLREAFDDVKYEFSYGSVGDKAGAIAKLASKTVANAGLLVVDIGVDLVRNAPEHLGSQAKAILKNENSHKLTEEQRSSLEERVKQGELHRKDREKKEWDDREKAN